MRHRLSISAWGVTVFIGASAVLGCGTAAEQADDEAPFDAVADGDGRVYGLRADGRPAVPLCRACTARGWSPDRRRVLVYIGGEELQVLTAGAGASRLALDLPEAPTDDDPVSWQLTSAWAGDGAWLAYVWNGAQAFIADADGQNPVELATNEPAAPMPTLTAWDSSVSIAWAPSNDQVALRFPSGGVYIGAPASSDVVTLDGIWDAAMWSPDGALLALTGPHGAQLVDAEGGNVAALETDAATRAIGWSNDSSFFAYLLAGEQNEAEEAKLAAADGSDAVSLGPAQSGAWAPSSPQLALARAPSKDADQPGQLSVWSADAVTDVATDSLSSDRPIDAIAWSSSGERLLYSVRGGAPEAYWSVIDPADGSELQRFTGDLFALWNPAGAEVATLIPSDETWTLWLESDAASATLLGQGIARVDGWSWLAIPGYAAFANTYGIFVTDLRGANTRVEISEGSRLRFHRTTPGHSACPLVGGDCSDF